VIVQHVSVHGCADDSRDWTGAVLGYTMQVTAQGLGLRGRTRPRSRDSQTKVGRGVSCPPFFGQGSTITLHDVTRYVIKRNGDQCRSKCFVIKGIGGASRTLVA
jgi:hypothetical protein